MMASSSVEKAGVPRDIDARGFVYALEPVRQRQEWRLDKAMAALAQAQKRLAETEVKMTKLMASHDEQAQRLSQALVQRLDPAAHRRSLAYLTDLRGQWHQADVLGKEQRAECDALRALCLQEQVRLEGLTQHKEDALLQYGDEARQRSLTEQDRDWLARLPANADRSDFQEDRQ